MEYVTSDIEIKRRKLAYISLSLSLVAGTFFSSVIYQFQIHIAVYLVLSLSLFMLGAFSFYFFRKISSLKINVSTHSLQRKVDDHLEAYPLTKIKNVKIKWTTRHTIREIYIWMNDGKSVFLTGLKSFEGFRTDLLAKLDKQVIVHEWREPIDFDSLWFYPVLGLVISNVSILAFKNLIRLNDYQMRIGMRFFGGYLFIFGLYFIFAAPISKRSGNKTKQQDYIIGILMLLAGIFIGFAKLGGA